MRILRFIGLTVYFYVLAGCTTAPMFPQDVVNNAKPDTLDFKDWVEQTYHPSHDDCRLQKVELGEKIVDLIRQPESVAIHTEELPIEAHQMYSPKSIDRAGTLKFAIAFTNERIAGGRG